MNTGLTPTGDIFADSNDPELTVEINTKNASEIKINLIFNCLILFESNLTLFIKLRFINA